MDKLTHCIYLTQTFEQTSHHNEYNQLQLYDKIAITTDIFKYFFVQLEFETRVLLLDQVEKQNN